MARGAVIHDELGSLDHHSNCFAVKSIHFAISAFETGPSVKGLSRLKHFWQRSEILAFRLGKFHERKCAPPFGRGDLLEHRFNRLFCGDDCRLGVDARVNRLTPTTPLVLWRLLTHDLNETVLQRLTHSGVGGNVAGMGTRGSQGGDSERLTGKLQLEAVLDALLFGLGIFDGVGHSMCMLVEKIKMSNRFHLLLEVQSFLLGIFDDFLDIFTTVIAVPNLDELFIVCEVVDLRLQDTGQVSVVNSLVVHSADILV